MQLSEKAGAIILSKNDPRRMLLVYRSQYQDWSFPKGHIEQGESSEQAMRREVLEETGLTVTVVAPLPDFNYTPRAKGSAVAHYFLTQSVDDAGMRPEPEYPDDRVEWVPIEKVAGRLTHQNLKEYFKTIKGKIVLP